MSEEPKPQLPDNMLRVGAAVRARIERAREAGEAITDELIGQAVVDAMFANVGKGGSFSERMQRHKPPTQQ